MIALTVTNGLKQRATILRFIKPGWTTSDMMSTVNTTRSSSDEEVGDPAPDEKKLSKDETFHILQNERRRRVLEYLADSEDPVNMRDIAEQVAAWEHDTTVAQLSSDQRQRVYIALYQSHLPKLDDIGLINYNRSRGIVERTELADQVDRYLDVDDEDDDAGQESMTPRWTLYYTGITLLSVALIAAAWAGVAAIPSLELATLITGMYAVVTLILVMYPTADA